MLCPATGVDGRADVRSTGGRIAAPSATARGPRAIDAGGPARRARADRPARARLRRASPTTASTPTRTCCAAASRPRVDAGSAGAQTFPGLRRSSSSRRRRASTRTSTSPSQGMISALVGELEDLRWASVAQCVRVAEANRDVIVGVKLRAGLPDGRPDPRAGVSSLAREAADALGAAADGARHRHGACRCLAARAAAAGRRRHALLPRQRGRLLDEDGRVLARGARGPRARRPVRRRARRRRRSPGASRGRRSRRASRPTRSRATSTPTTTPGPVHDLPRTLSKLLHLGMPLPDVIAAATARVGGASRARRTRPGSGTLAPGAPGDLSLLERQRGRFALADGEHRLLGGRDRARRRAPRGTAGRARAAPSSRATSRRDGAAHHGRPRRRARRRARRRRRAGRGRPVAAVGEAAARRPRARRTRLLRAAGRLRSARARLRGPRRGARGRAALRHDRGRGLRAARAGRARGGRLRALARARRGRGLPHRAARDGVRAGMHSTRHRSRHSPRRACAASSCSWPTASSAWTPTTSCCCVRSSGAASTASCHDCTARTPARSRCCASGCAAAGDLGVDAHPRSRPPLVEEEGIRRALDLARLAEAPVYIVHVSTAGGVDGDPPRARRGRST